MRGSRVIRVVLDGLQKVELHSLSRPPVKPTEEPTGELINWGAQVYVYSVIAHIRTVLKGLVQVADSENIPVAFIIVRHVFEWAAHAAYMSRSLRVFYKQKQWKEAWELLTASATGNRWIKRYGSKYAPVGATWAFDDTPDPIHISKVMTALERHEQETFGLEDAKDTYGHLSEHSHPNSACLQQYHRWDTDGRALNFCDPAPSSSPLSSASRALIALLMCFHDLLAMSRESSVRQQLKSLLEEIAKLAPKKNATSQSHTASHSEEQ